MLRRMNCGNIIKYVLFSSSVVAWIIVVNKPSSLYGIISNTWEDPVAGSVVNFEDNQMRRKEYCILSYWLTLLWSKANERTKVQNNTQYVGWVSIRQATRAYNGFDIYSIFNTIIILPNPHIIILYFVGNLCLLSFFASANHYSHLCLIVVVEKYVRCYNNGCYISQQYFWFQSSYETIIIPSVERCNQLLVYYNWRRS